MTKLNHATNLPIPNTSSNDVNLSNYLLELAVNQYSLGTVKLKKDILTGFLYSYSINLKSDIKYITKDELFRAYQNIL